MASLVPDTSKKSDTRNAQTERVLRARAGMAAFSQSVASQANVKAETAPVRKAFLSGIGGTTDAATAQTIALAQKADKLSALPVSARKTAERFDADTQAFINVVYARHAETGEPIDFTDQEAAKIMQRSPDQARHAVEALVSVGVLQPSYSPMGSLKGYLPEITA